MRKHPGIWFTLWSFETLFFLCLLFAVLDLSEFERNLSQLFVRVWLYICVWFITVFHVRWMMKIDEKQYKKNKDK
jgi:uncharacterized protein involved in response to NO